MQIFGQNKTKLIGTGGIPKEINTQKMIQKKNLDLNFSWPADIKGLKNGFQKCTWGATLKPKTTTG